MRRVPEVPRWKGSRFTPVETGSLAARIQERLERQSPTTPSWTAPARGVELADAFRVSRASLREALRLLENKGLVVSIPRRGTFVAELTEQDVRAYQPARAARRLCHPASPKRRIQISCGGWKTKRISSARLRPTRRPSESSIMTSPSTA
ncbi:MAG: GntR family transcriptional regulator [Thermomicrobiales bacterium]